MMKSQVANFEQSTGSGNQKKSVFDRLGRQIDQSSSATMKRRPSPGPYGDYMPPPPMHDVDFNRHNQAELEWRYQEERRHIAFSRERPPMQLPPSPYEMEMAGRQPPYYPHPNHPYHSAQSGPLPPMMGPGSMPIGMHQQRSPKYDRHGNPIPGFKERIDPMRMGPMGHHHEHMMSPLRSFPPPGQMLPPGPHEMPPMRQNAMYPPHRWMENMEPDFVAAHSGRMPPEERFNARYQQPPQSQMASNSQQAPFASEAPRYAKWRERRDVITSLDKETAQSSSRTDSLKSFMQQPEGSRSSNNNNSNQVKASAKQNLANQREKVTDGQPDSETKDSSSKKDSSSSKQTDKSEPQDISDGEIIGDEDSSDENDTELSKVPSMGTSRKDPDLMDDVLYRGRPKVMTMPYGRSREAHQYYEPNKKRRLLERDDYAMDYETISEDEDLDVFMGEKGKMSDLGPDDAKLDESLAEDGAKSMSEIDLLNALGLDWANLVEMAKQSWTKNSKGSTGSALSRFSLQNYLPSLGITPELAGPELYDLVLKICRP